MQINLFEEILKQKAVELLNSVNETDNRKNKITELIIIKINANLYLLSAKIKDSKVFNIVDSFGEIPNGFSANWRTFQHIKQELGL